MRVIAGKARATKLNAPSFDGARPTLDRVKESIFSSIQYSLNDSYCLDAFACSGALGIEALSRGAAFVDFCEINNSAIKVLKDNLIKTRMKDNFAVYDYDVFTFIEESNHKYDIVFADPPYNNKILEVLFEGLYNSGSLKDGSLIIAEHEKKLKLDEVYNFSENFKLELAKRKTFSYASVSFYKCFFNNL